MVYSRFLLALSLLRNHQLYQALLLLALLPLGSCATNLVVHKGFYLKAGGQPPGARAKPSGCFVYSSSEYRFATRIFLYADGSAALSGLVCKTRDEVLRDMVDSQGRKRIRGTYDYLWGRYEITGDQLLVQLVSIRPPWDNGLVQLVGEVANDSTFLIRHWQTKRFDTTYAAPRVYRLDPQIPKPDSLNWLCRKRWYYADGKVPEGER
jgi:hypothetical protein